MKKVPRLINGHLVLVTLCPPRAAQGAFDSLFDDPERGSPILGGYSVDEYQALTERQGPCPDDCETTAPFIDPIDDDLEGEGSNGAEIMGFVSMPRRIRKGGGNFPILDDSF